MKLSLCCVCLRGQRLAGAPPRVHKSRRLPLLPRFRLSCSLWRPLSQLSVRVAAGSSGEKYLRNENNVLVTLYETAGHEALYVTAPRPSCSSLVTFFKLCGGLGARVGPCPQRCTGI